MPYRLKARSTRAFLILLYILEYSAISIKGYGCCNSSKASPNTKFYMSSSNVKLNRTATGHTAWRETVNTLDRLHELLTLKRIARELSIYHPKIDDLLATRSRSAQFAFNESWHWLAHSDEQKSEAQLYTLHVVGVRVEKTDRKKSRAKNNYGEHLAGSDNHNLPYVFTLKKPQNDMGDSVINEARLELTGLHGNEYCNALLTQLDWSLEADAQHKWNEIISGKSTFAELPVNITNHLQNAWNVSKNHTLVLRSLLQVKHKHCPVHSRNLHRLLPILHIRVNYKESVNIRPARHVRAKLTRTLSGNSTRKRIIVDCEQQWDQTFLSSTSSGIYDSLMPCCRRRFRISFEQLGWDNWVFAPKHFDSYYCIGRCSEFGGFQSEDMEGIAFYAELMNLYRKAEAAGLAPCCTPVKFTPLTIAIWQGPNEQITQTLDGIIVKQCGCM
uniref:TGF_BETA_2 domain-containing protein n=1 Tax=Trichuris muris TaxID=70415 RepID=A0A5S6QJT8_TRIMR